MERKTDSLGDEGLTNLDKAGIDSDRGAVSLSLAVGESNPDEDSLAVGTLVSLEPIEEIGVTETKIPALGDGLGDNNVTETLVMTSTEDEEVVLLCVTVSLREED